MNSAKYNVYENDRDGKDYQGQVTLSECDQRSSLTPNMTTERRKAIVVFCLLILTTVTAFTAIFVLHFNFQEAWYRERMDLNASFQKLREKNSNEFAKSARQSNATVQKLKDENDRKTAKMERQCNATIQKLNDANYQAFIEVRSLISNKSSGITSFIEENYVRRDLLDVCDFISAGKCFFLVMPVSRVAKPEAEAECMQRGSHLANIYSRLHYQQLQSLIRSRSPIGSKYNHVWTGMAMDIQARGIRLSNGELAPSLPWYPGRPLLTADAIAVGIHANSAAPAVEDGVFDENVAGGLYGGLCEKDLNGTST